MKIDGSRARGVSGAFNQTLRWFSQVIASVCVSERRQYWHNYLHTWRQTLHFTFTANMNWSPVVLWCQEFGRRILVCSLVRWTRSSCVILQIIQYCGQTGRRRSVQWPKLLSLLLEWLTSTGRRKVAVIAMLKDWRCDHLPMATIQQSDVLLRKYGETYGRSILSPSLLCLRGQHPKSDK